MSRLFVLLAAVLLILLLGLASYGCFDNQPPSDVEPAAETTTEEPDPVSPDAFPGEEITLIDTGGIGGR